MLSLTKINHQKQDQFQSNEEQSGSTLQHRPLSRQESTNLAEHNITTNLAEHTITPVPAKDKKTKNFLELINKGNTSGTKQDKNEAAEGLKKKKFSGFLKTKDKTKDKEEKSKPKFPIQPLNAEEMEEYKKNHLSEFDQERFKNLDVSNLEQELTQEENREAHNEESHNNEDPNAHLAERLSTLTVRAQKKSERGDLDLSVRFQENPEEPEAKTTSREKNEEMSEHTEELPASERPHDQLPFADPLNKSQEQKSMLVTLNEVPDDKKAPLFRNDEKMFNVKRTSLYEIAHHGLLEKNSTPAQTPSSSEYEENQTPASASSSANNSQENESMDTEKIKQSEHSHQKEAESYSDINSPSDKNKQDASKRNSLNKESSTPSIKFIRKEKKSKKAPEASPGEKEKINQNDISSKNQNESITTEEALTLNKNDKAEIQKIQTINKQTPESQKVESNTPSWKKVADFVGLVVSSFFAVLIIEQMYLFSHNAYQNFMDPSKKV